MPIACHSVTSANAALLDRVAADVFDHDISPERLAAYLADPLHGLIVAVEDSVVVGHIRGCVHLQPDREPDLYIDNLGVASSHKRRGIASRLMADLIAWGAARGCTYVWVATELDNAEGLGFYASRRLARDTIAMFAADIG